MSLPPGHLMQRAATGNLKDSALMDTFRPQPTLTPGDGNLFDPADVAFTTPLRFRLVSPAVARTSTLPDMLTLGGGTSPAFMTDRTYVICESGPNQTPLSPRPGCGPAARTNPGERSEAAAGRHVEEAVEHDRVRSRG